ncbi:MAG: amidohydrolase, partial [Alphaproteobacteria bacterium]|nr:amidohydrolase [Alphaproteobacteria bacterium]
DMTRVLAEAHEMVDHGLITEADFRDFTYGNVVGMHTGMNPAFFKGTAVEDKVEAYKAENATLAAQ